MFEGVPRMSKIVRLSFAVLMAVALSALTMAQSTTTGAIGGVVTNPNKETIAGAAVTVRNNETNKEESVTSDDQGSFRIVNLQPGTYSITINASGFSAYTQDRVVVEVGRQTPLNPSLSIGPVQGTVEVTSEAPVINTSQQDFSSNVNQTSINELPINGRRWSNFALLTPGAVPDGSFGLVSFRGLSGLLNNNTVDGGDNNQAFFSEERGRTRLNYSISQAAVREFQVNTSNYSAEYGRAAGGVVNAVTKSGTNDFHGNAFFYVRDERFNARNPQSFLTLPDRTVVGVKPEDNRKQFGAAIGGPIVKDRLFFFFSYDEQRRLFPGIAINTNPTFFDTVDRTRLTARGVTTAQIDSGLAFLQSLTGEVNRRGDQRLFLPKIDWVISDSHTLTGTYNRLRWKSPNGIQTSSTVTRGRGSFGDDLVDVDWVTLRLASTFSPTVLNEARFQWGRDFERQQYTGPVAGEPATGPNGTSPSLAITGGLTSGKPNFLDRRAFPDEKRQQYADTVTVSSGNHTLKFGVDINRVSDVSDNLFQEAGVYSYSTINDFIVDFANFNNSGALRTAGVACGFPTASTTRFAGQCYNGNFNQGFGPTRFVFRTSDLNFFVQDDWRVNPRLTLNLGLRYEYQKLPEPQQPNSLWDSDSRFTAKTGVFPADKNNFGPRVGFAYDLSGTGRTSLRGGAGLYYGRIQNSTISNAITNTGLSTAQIQISTTSAIFPQTFSSAAAASGGAVPIPNIVVMSSELQNPTILQADAIFEHMIGQNTAFSASYLLSAGYHLTTFVDINLPPAAATTTFTFSGGPFGGQTVTVPRFSNQQQRINNNFNTVTEVRSNIGSEYHALVLQLNRRLTQGMQLQTSYTYSSARDANQQTGTFTAGNVPYDPNNYENDKGPSDFDLRHRYVASAVLMPDLIFGLGDSGAQRALLGDWTIAPVFVIQSGFPYSFNTTGSIATAATIRGGSGLTGSGGGNRIPPPLGGRNVLRFPKFWNFDLRLSRRISLSESAKLEFLAEGFNLFNRTHVIGNLDTTAYSISGSTLTFRPAFQTITPPPGETLYKSRQFQFAVRLAF
jgi:hypothetical protein